jgi:uncharacterized membrane protein (DUF485 family)
MNTRNTFKHLQKYIKHFTRPQVPIFMRSLLYIIVVILVISWLLGGFAFHVGGDAIHIIIVIAVILLLLNLINGGSRLDRGRWW